MADGKPAGPGANAAGNPALRMLGIRLPKKLPSRNWMIFFAITGSFSTAVIYDRRERDRATLKWAKSVSHLAKEPLPSASQLPRKLTVYLEAPPGDSLRIAQEHYKQYVKPILATSGLDWEFVQGREEGDIRAAVAERIRRVRRKERGETLEPTDADLIQDIRQTAKIPDFEGVKGDIVVGRHTWKEYVRGLHEGWLGPLEPPPEPTPEPTMPTVVQGSGDEMPKDSVEEGNVEVENPNGDEKPSDEKPSDEKKEEEEKKTPSRPKQPPPHNKPEDYEASELPTLIPYELQPATTIPFPFLLGFSRTPKRVWRYLHRRELADNIGREVASAVLATYRDFRVESEGVDSNRYEQQTELESEEECWVKSIWKQDDPAKQPDLSKEKIWTRPIVLDPRIATRMRRFQIESTDEERARQAEVKEEEIEGFLKGSARSFWRWGVSLFAKQERKPPIPIDDDE